ncbi:peptidoglycan-recognition protein SC2-like 2 [Homarus americanus]|uniref:Peptidoglycan-recognition protein SC2-like 2 n=1 Tax=Homarus americanus TaxID=6706 RepID=A0A8J5JTF9_HOMAM|nr:peptidoglycan-recognition protein SC2-like 2 [Homarus americanus]
MLNESTKTTQLAPLFTNTRVLQKKVIKVASYGTQATSLFVLDGADANKMAKCGVVFAAKQPPIYPGSMHTNLFRLSTFGNHYGYLVKGAHLTRLSSEASPLSWDELSSVSREATGAYKRDFGGDCSRLSLVSREEWEAREPVLITPLNLPMRGVFVHHSAMAFCETTEECVAELKIIQALHMDTNCWDDIGYSFLVGENGKVYEGRGWDRQGAHTKYYNRANYGICGKLIEDFKMFGHRDARNTTACPGQKLYENLQTWSIYGHDKNMPK